MKTSYILFVCLFAVGCSAQQNNNSEASTAQENNDSIQKTANLNRTMDSLVSEVYNTNKSALLDENKKMNLEFMEKRNYLIIEQTVKGKIMVRNEEVNAGYAESIRRFYLTNKDSNDFSNNYPLYFKTEKKYVANKIIEVENTMKKMRAENFSEEMISFKQDQIDAWREYETIHTLFNSSTFRQIGPVILFVIKYPADSDGKDFLKSVLSSIYDLRNEICMTHFQEEYAEIYVRWLTEKNLLDEQKLRTAQILIPISIIDETNIARHKKMFLPVKRF